MKIHQLLVRLSILVLLALASLISFVGCGSGTNSTGEVSLKGNLSQHGLVASSATAPVQGASVGVYGRSDKDVTDSFGNFTLQLPSASVRAGIILQFSAESFEFTYEITKIPSNVANINVQLRLNESNEIKRDSEDFEDANGHALEHRDTDFDK